MGKGRNDSRDRSAFREHVQEQIESGKAPHFEALTNGEGGWHDWSQGWVDQEGNTHDYGKSGFYSDMGTDFSYFETDWDSGHTTSSAAGVNAYAIEGRTANRSDAALEREGVILEKPAVEIETLSVNRDLAESMEAHGLFDEGTVDAAPESAGQTRETGFRSVMEETEAVDLESNTTTETAVTETDVFEPVDLEPDRETDAFEPVDLEPETETDRETDAFEPIDLEPDPETDRETDAFEPVDLEPDPEMDRETDAFEPVDLEPDTATTEATETSAFEPVDLEPQAETETDAFEPVDLEPDTATTEAPAVDSAPDTGTGTGTGSDSDGDGE